MLSAKKKEVLFAFFQFIKYITIHHHPIINTTSTTKYNNVICQNLPVFLPASSYRRRNIFWTASDPIDDFFSFSDAVYHPTNISKKIKRRGAPEFTPKDREESMFWRTYVLPSRDEKILLEHSVRNEFSKAGRKFRKRFSFFC